MLSVDHSDTDDPPLAVKCVRKFGSALGGEVTSVCVCVCVCIFGSMCFLTSSFSTTFTFLRFKTVRMSKLQG